MSAVESGRGDVTARSIGQASATASQSAPVRDDYWTVIRLAPQGPGSCLTHECLYQKVTYNVKASIRQIETWGQVKEGYLSLLWSVAMPSVRTTAPFFLLIFIFCFAAISGTSASC